MNQKKIKYPLRAEFFERYQFGSFTVVPGTRRNTRARETATQLVIEGAMPGTERRFNRVTGAELRSGQQNETQWAYVELQQ